MCEVLDLVTKKQAVLLHDSISAARGVVIPRTHNEGDCELCGHWSGDLNQGECAPCREKFKHN